MGRSILFHCLRVSNSSPRLSSSLGSPGGKNWKKIAANSSALLTNQTQRLWFSLSLQCLALATCCSRDVQKLCKIMLPYDTQQLSKAKRDTAAIYLACGVDTSKASVFMQSHVHAHVELTRLLSSTTPIGWLNRMIQFKEKSRKVGDENVELLS
ncbi:tryptophan--tRNA ligase, chloroplastic/mitochondrial-like isoform X1 [Mangifera indica]|uniref:tryptophan--tRNA ligase, chloroplastic/mitochondrial-like isoform X1 n=1 Tax=Mangifera indica TaxID=29780 RepID=UPI001CF9698D|nr:tryptophan--tRNA ligase, chloroplastic/mitochondrial-like isoform X1 [Mangifera indica]